MSQFEFAIVLFFLLPLSHRRRRRRRQTTKLDVAYVWMLFYSFICTPTKTTIRHFAFFFSIFSFSHPTYKRYASASVYGYKRNNEKKIAKRTKRKTTLD